MTYFSSYQRNATIKQLAEETLDVLVIGGGITGAGISLDAVTRGLNTGLIEMQDFAAGTSSRSTKLVHGGLRYLEQFEFKIVAEVGREREIVYENGPHVTTPERMMLPFYKGGSFGPFTANIGLLVYDLLAGVKRNERRQMFKPEEAIEIEPLLNQTGLKGAGYYVEYKTDDARLTIEVLKKSVEHGTKAINYTRAKEFIYDDVGNVIGVMAKDEITGKQLKIYAKKIINAAGPWVDELREADGSKQGKTLHLTKGVHLVFSQEEFPLQQAIYFDAPDGRMIFAIPRNNKTYVGTTDTSYEGDIARPIVTKEDRDYVLYAVNYMFPSLKITADHVDSSWAGLRPLIAEGGKNPGEIPRKDEVFISSSGLISMAGGKLTGYRKMAQEVMDLVVKQIKLEEGILYSGSDTRSLAISGGEVGGSTGFRKFKREKMDKGVNMGLDQEVVSLLIQQYGSNVDAVFKLYEENLAEASTLQMDPTVLAELIYAIEYELAYTPSDFFIRRTSALFFNIDWVREHKQTVIDYMSDAFQWTDEQRKYYELELNESLHEAANPE